MKLSFSFLKNEIMIIIKGKGFQKLLNENIPIPNKIIINNITQNQVAYKCELTEPENIIIISWEIPLPTCEQMFYNLENITYIDLSNLDGSAINTMHEMFSGCINLKSINLNILNTTIVKNMENLFYNCKSLESLDFYKLNTISVRTMVGMFSKCTSLKTLDLSNFNTEKVESMENMFLGATSLISLDLSNFNLTSVLNMNKMFYDCNSLMYLNLKSFGSKQGNISVDDIFSDNLKNIIYCIDEKNTSNILVSIKSVNQNNNCDNPCFTDNQKIKECAENSEYSEEIENYKSIYISEIPIIINENSTETNKITDNLINTEKEINNNISEYFEDKTNKETNKEPDEETNNLGNDEETNKENGEETYKETNIETNKETNKEINTEINTENNKETNKEKVEETYKETNKEINKETNTEINIETNKETNKETTKKFSSEEFFKESLVIKDESIINKDKIIDNIREDLLNGNLDLFDLTNGTKQDLLVQQNDIIYQITTTENQKKNEYKNISTINLNLCEERLKSKNNISKEQSLIIFKVDYYIPGLLIPVIGYEVYHPTEKYQLNLSICSDILVNLNIPISINENTLYKYDPNSEYYTDECSSYTAESGADILLNDRQNEYNDNNYSICESNCNLNGYNSDSKKSICECKTKAKIDSISDIINNDNIISSNFKKDNSTLNLGTMKCVSTLFSKEGLIANIGSYLLIFNIFFFSISLIIYFKCGNQIILNMIKRNELPINKGSSQKLNIYVGAKKLINNKKRKKRKSKSMKISNPLKRSSKKSLDKTKSSYSKKSLDKPKTRYSKKSLDKPKARYSKRKMSDEISSKTILKNVNEVLDYGLKKNETKINKKEKNEYKLIKYKNCELNSLPYKKALIYDKRTFGQYYFYLLLLKQPILFSFFPNDDYNLIIIKISLFFLSFDIYLVVNTFFFSKSSIHQIYEDEGNYNLSFFFPNIIYSFFISYIFITLIKYFSLSENNILEINNEENIKRKNNKIEKIRKCLFIKYLLFYCLSLAFVIIFFYYLSSFCAVYKNTQIFVIKNTSISFLISLLFPLVFVLLPCSLRIFSLINEKNEIIYKISNYLQLL